MAPGPPGATVELPLGTDLFRAQVIEASVQAEGYLVRLRPMTGEGTPGGMGALEQHRLLVRADDLAAVRAIVDRTFPTGG